MTKPNFFPETTVLEHCAIFEELSGYVVDSAKKNAFRVAPGKRNVIMMRVIEGTRA